MEPPGQSVVTGSATTDFPKRSAHRSRGKAGHAHGAHAHLPIHLERNSPAHKRFLLL